MVNRDQRDARPGLEGLARERVAELLARAESHFGIGIARPEIRFDLRGKAAGQFRSRDGHHCELRFNRELMLRHGERFLDRTVPHEAAHLVAFLLNGPRVRPHGKEWQAIMHLFGTAPERCHEYDVAGLQTRRLRRYLYRCACRAHQLSSIRHNRILRGQTYFCRACGSELQRTATPPSLRADED
jgi:SprT protein